MSVSFKKFLAEEERTIFFTFGRMNPPTANHGKLMDILAEKSGANPYRIYLDQKSNDETSPLDYVEKVKWVRKMFPKHSRHVIKSKKIRTVFDVLTALYDEGFLNVVLIVGAEKVREMDLIIKKRNGQKGVHGFYNFGRIQVASSGQPDADEAPAAKLHESIRGNDFIPFSKSLPKAISNSDSQSLFNDARRGFGLSMCKEFRNDVVLEPVSEAREEYISGNLFVEGDAVKINSSGKQGFVKKLGANHVIVECDGYESRQWLESISKITSTKMSLKTFMAKAR